MHSVYCAAQEATQDAYGWFLYDLIFFFFHSILQIKKKKSQDVKWRWDFFVDSAIKNGNRIGRKRMNFSAKLFLPLLSESVLPYGLVSVWVSLGSVLLKILF